MITNFKKISLFAQTLLIVLLCVSCGPDIHTDGPHLELSDSFIGGASTAVNDKNRDRVFRDTITPPSNPMNEVPYVPGTPVRKAGNTPVRKAGNSPEPSFSEVAGSIGVPASKTADLAEAPVGRVADLVEAPVRKVGGLPDVPIRVAKDSPEMTERTVVDSSAAVERKGEDSPVMAGRAVSKAPEFEGADFRRIEDNLLRQVVRGAEDLSGMPAGRAGSSPEMPVPRVADPVGVQAGKAGELPEVPIRIAKDSPEMAWRAVQDSPATGRRAVATSTQPEQVQIIAPAPLPIELPAAAVRQQPVSAAPSAIAHMFVAAAEAVADAILVSSGFANGEGSLIVRLRPEVLGGSEIRLVAKDGALAVVVNAATQDVQEMVETNRTRFEQHLAEKVHTWRISVAVRRGGRSDERV